MNNARLDAFMTVYTMALQKAKADHPEDYHWTPSATVESVSAKMRAAFKDGTFNHDGRAIRATCRVLGIKTTRTAIRAFLAGDPA